MKIMLYVLAAYICIGIGYTLRYLVEGISNLKFLRDEVLKRKGVPAALIIDVIVMVIFWPRNAAQRIQSAIKQYKNPRLQRFPRVIKYPYQNEYYYPYRTIDEYDETPVVKVPKE